MNFYVVRGSGTILFGRRPFCKLFSERQRNLQVVAYVVLSDCVSLKSKRRRR